MKSVSKTLFFVFYLVASFAATANTITSSSHWSDNLIYYIIFDLVAIAVVSFSLWMALYLAKNSIKHR